MRGMTVPLRRILVVAAVALVMAAESANAQSRASSSDKRDQEIELLKQQVRQLQEQVKTLEGLNTKVKEIDRKLEIQGNSDAVATDVARTKALEEPLVKANDEGFRLQSANDDYRIRLGGLLQVNPRFFTSGDDKNISSSFYVNKARPILSGALGKYYEFQVMPDFGQGKTSLQDAWVNVAYWSAAQLQIGKYKAYVSLERLQSDPALQFVQRSELQNLVPNRDIGAQVNGILFDKRLTYQLGLMNGVPNNASTVDFDSNDAKDFVGRLFLTPFRWSENQWIEGLGFGLGSTLGNERGSTLSSYTTWGQQTWFRYNNGVTMAGQRDRIDAQAYYYWRQLGLLAEYAQDTHRMNLTTSTINRTDNFTDTGYVAQASYFLTGENASYGFVRPLNPFDPFNPFDSGWGAWELTARISNVATSTRQFQLGYANPSLSAKSATEFALGFNWTLTNNIKYWFDFANTFFDGGGGTTSAPRDRINETVLESQFQLAF